MISLILVLAASAPASVSPCAPDETVLFACPVKKKQLVVCGGPGETPAWAQYRYGPPGKPELVYPETRKKGLEGFVFAERALPSGLETTLSFTRGQTSYEIWSTDGIDGAAGVIVTEKGKTIARIGCSGDYEADWNRVQAMAKSPRPPPSPLEGKTQAQICRAPELILLQASWEELTGESGFHELCCSKRRPGDELDGVCDYDWPYPSMTPCRYLDLLRNALYARYGYVFKDETYRKYFARRDWYEPRPDFSADWLPAVVQKNVATLKAASAGKKGCYGDEEFFAEELQGLYEQ